MAKGMNVKKMLKGVNVEQVVVCILVVVLVVLVVYYVNKNSEGFNNDNSKPTLYFFYVDWCPHCTRAKETTFNDDKWNTVDNKDSVNLVKVDCEASEENKALANEHNVQGYPSVVLKNNKKKTELEEGVSPSSISNLISNF